MKKMFKCSAVIFTLLVSAMQVNAAKFETGQFNLEGEDFRFVKLTGEIKNRDSLTFDRLLAKAKQKNEPIDLLVLNSTGGDLEESYKLIDSIIDNDVSTIVLPKDKCISACVGVLASGAERIIYPTSIIGVHRASNSDHDTDVARSASIEMMEVYKDLEIPDSVRLKMIETPPDEVYYLSIKEKGELSSQKIAAEKPKTPAAEESIDDIISGMGKQGYTAAGNYD